MSKDPSPSAAGDSGTAGTDTTAARPLRITLAAALLALEGLAVAGGGLIMLVLLLAGSSPENATQALAGSVTALLLALLPLLTARGLWRLRRWSRSPAVFVQLLALPVGWTMGNGQGAWVAGGLALAAVAITVLVCLFHPRSNAALGATGAPDA
ncbi:hypothetical protein QNO07_24410 [Streptomyces sp. 549]|uniref:hypothetical protein n=1 Tax=Streptomyces sp. 549 TaxID=3049076 RepID=UPI0024C349E4|nr:hypothetical protein [Streptomyces sp. 549]MDK1476508.1 hypothetical protein [Streptomyces sp. 549]